MAKFQRKPEKIEALQFTGKNDAECLAFCPVARDPEDIKANLIIPTSDGEMLVSIGDHIAKDARGEFYPYRPHVFEELFEPEHECGEGSFAEDGAMTWMEYQQVRPGRRWDGSNWKDKVNDMVSLVGDTHWLATVAAACRKAGEAIPWEQSHLKAIAEDIDNLVVTRFESGRTEPEEVFKGTALAPGGREGGDGKHNQV